MFALVIILVFVAVAMASKTPNEDLGVSLPPDTSIPSTGATDKFSPALTGGSPLIAQDNRIRLGMTYKNSPNLLPHKRLTTSMSGSRGILGGLTDAQSSLKTQDVPPLVKTVSQYSPSTFRNTIKY